MAASRRGSMEALVSKMLFLHLPATHPASFPEIELSPLVQASALLGVGLLYEGSCHRLMVETMLAEIGRRPSSGANAKAAAAAGNTKGDDEGGVVTDREGYALAAGYVLAAVSEGAVSVQMRDCACSVVMDKEGHTLASMSEGPVSVQSREKGVSMVTDWQWFVRGANCASE
ncbi:hypothetical protein DUNSADRAFT_5360 [Dunaliella salina]|uniref:Late endosomal/lysosomal adaptor and MAPK and MTOR activator 5 n=1 Tax=Dunaliella salina TaxID=3046 RepID=A0ABQ7GQC9_DUNSA|nr:hypothetical protein DUNSADRAFT_5360 [Dunaliella salina]|eukprot:KAF5836820.1 hypothetical protein DUNSADRAFT_5360 [Dunaliella salina]